MTLESLYQKWVEADDTWHAELIKEYGLVKAGEYRYTEKGYATPKLKELYDAFIAARMEYRKAQHNI